MQRFTLKRLFEVSTLATTALCLTGAVQAAELNTGALAENGWYSDDTRADGTGTETAGTNLISPTLTDDPEGTASGTATHDADILSMITFGFPPVAAPTGTHGVAVHLAIGPSASGKSQISDRKDDGTGHGPGSILGPGFSAEYSWMGDGTVSVTASLKFGIKTADFGSTGVSSRTGENVWDKVLIYEPGNLNGGTADGAWHTETVTHTSGKWWFFDRTAGASIIGTPMTLSDMSTSGTLVGGGPKTVADVYALMTAPGAHITSVQFGVGSGNMGASVYVNQLETNAYRAGDTTTFGTPPIRNADTGEVFPTIQAAIDDADTLDGHVIEVLAAEHAEGPQVFFTKSLTLRGTGTNTVKMVGNTTTGGDGRGWFLVDSGRIVHFEDLAFDGDGNLIWQAIRHKGAGSVSNCSFNDIRYQVSGSPYAGNAVVAFGTGTVDVTDVTCTLIGRQGIFYFGAGVNGSVCSGLTYTGKGVIDGLDYGVEIGGGAEATVENATIIDCVGVAASDGSTSGAILVTTFFGAGSSAIVSGSSLTGNTTGIAVGFDAADTSTLVANFNNISGNDNGVVNTSLTNVVDAKQNWWGDAGGPDDPGGTIPAVNGFCAPVADIVNANPPGDSVDDNVVCYCPWAETMLAAPGEGTLTLEVPAGCLSDDQISVELWMRDLTTPVTGFQAFLAYDDAILDYRGDLTTYSGAPFSLHIQPAGTAEAISGELRFDGSVAPGDSATVLDALLVTIVFDVVTECSSTSVTYDLTQLFDSELSFEGTPIDTNLLNTPSFTLDDTPPVLDPCPADITVPADADSVGGCTGAIVTFTAPGATDNCDGALTSTCVPASGTLFLVGTTTVTCTVEDACGNESDCMFDVTVTPTNEVFLDVELVGVSLASSRCIHFVTDSCGTTADFSLAFVDHDGDDVNEDGIDDATFGTTNDPSTPVRFSGSIEVPCGEWTQLCAKDEQHTLWDTQSLALSGGGESYIASATFSLEPGDNDNDGDVDINDVTFVIATFGDLAVSGGCPSDGTRDADFDNGGAIGSEDYSLLSANWLTLTACSCAIPSTSPWVVNQRPKTWLSVDEVQPQIAERADLNRDGVIDATDVTIFEMRRGLPHTLSNAMRAVDASNDSTRRRK